jgi:hypothetical protein
MRKMSFVLMVVAALVVSSAVPVFADEPTHLSTTCVDPRDHNVRNIERGVCDATAETAGFQHGVWRPDQCSPHEKECVIKCEEVAGNPLQPYECVGVGHQEKKKETK